MLPSSEAPQPLPHHLLMGSGPCSVLLLCGFQADLNAWRWVQSRLARSFTTVAMDNRGYGARAFLDQPLSLEHMADDALALMKTLPPGPVYMAGHSMGGAVAQIIAHRAPERVRALALCNSFRHLGRPRTTHLLELAEQLANGADPTAVREQLMAGTFSSSALQQAAGQIIAHEQARRGVASTAGLRRQLEALARFDSRRWFKDISAPLLIMHSNQDREVLVQEARLMAAEQRACATLALPGGHASLVEQPQRLAEGLLHFFQGH